MTTITVQPERTGPRYSAPPLQAYIQPPDAGRWADRPGFQHLDAGDGWWVPRQLTWRINGQTSTLTLRRQLGIGPGRPGRDRPDPTLMHACIGSQVRLVQAAAGGGGAELFRGCVGRSETRIGSDPDVESLEITAYGPEARLSRTVIAGAWHKTTAADDLELAGELTETHATGAATFATNLPAAFNPGGRPNASGSLWRLADGASGNACRVFEAPGRVVRDAGGQTRIEATCWTAWTALRSVVEYWDRFETISPTGTNWEAIRSLLSDADGREFPIERVNVTGMDVAEALRAILLPLGVGFALEPWCCEGDRHRLLVFSMHEATVLKRPPMADVAGGVNVAADSPDGRRAQVQQLHFVRDHHDVRNEVLVVGDQIRRQVALEFTSDAGARDLHPAWDAADSANDLDAYDLDGCIGGPGQGDWADPAARAAFQERFGLWPTDANRHVFRTFVWNEDGAWSHVVADESGRPRIPDLAAYGLSGQAIRRARPLAGSLEFADPAGGQRGAGAYVEIGIEGDEASWTRLPGEGVCIHRDGAGFTVTVTPIDTWCPFAAAGRGLADRYGQHTWLTLLHNTLAGSGTKLRLRLTGSVACDECVTGLAQRDDGSGWPFRSQKLVYLPDRFKGRDVGGSQLAGYDVVDDSPAARAYARCLRGAWECAAAHGSLLLRGIHRGYAPGDGIDRTGGRNVPLSIDGRQGGQGPGAVPIVVGVAWELADGVNRTRLIFDSSREGRVP